MKRRPIAMLLCLLMVLSLVACGGKTEEAAPKAETKTETPAAAPEAAAPAEAAGEKVLRVGMKDTTNLDPMNDWSLPSYYFYWTVYERLIKLNYETGEYEPELATSWEVAEDGSTYTFKLREGVKWHDGKPFTSADVKYTIERGVELGTGNYPGVDYVEAPDEHTVVVHMTAADSVFLDKQWTGDCCVMQDGCDDSIGQWPIGTGPYKMEEWVAGDHITIVKNEDHWSEEGAPNDKIIFSIIPEDATRLVALQSGDIDIAPISATDVKHVEADENLNVLNKTGIWLDQLGFNCGKGPLADVRVRKAIAHAINRQAIVDGVLEGYGVVMNTPVAIGKVGYYDGVPAYEYNVEKAKELMAEAGYADGFELDLAIYSYPLVAQLIQYDLSQIGITVSITQMEKTAQLEFVNSGEADLFFWGRSGGPADIYVKSFSSTSNGSTAKNNFNYKNERVDELYELSHLTLDTAERNEVYKELQLIVMDELPTLPLFAADVFTGQHKDVTGFVPDAENCHDFRTATIG